MGRPWASSWQGGCKRGGGLNLPTQIKTDNAGEGSLRAAGLVSRAEAKRKGVAGAARSTKAERAWAADLFLR